MFKLQTYNPPKLPNIIRYWYPSERYVQGDGMKAGWTEIIRSGVFFWWCTQHQVPCQPWQLSPNLAHQLTHLHQSAECNQATLASLVLQSSQLASHICVILFYWSASGPKQGCSDYLQTSLHSLDPGINYCSITQLPNVVSHISCQTINSHGYDKFCIIITTHIYVSQLELPVLF